MIAVVNEKPMPKWRNALIWSAASVAIYGLVLAGVALVHDGSLAGIEFGPATGRMVAILIFASALAGFAMRRSPPDLRTFRNFLTWTALAVAVFALIAWSLAAFTGSLSPDAIGVSAAAALFVGLALLALAILGFVVIIAARANLLPAERAEAVLERGRMQLYTWTWLAALGLTLILLSLAGPGGLVSPGFALAAAVVLIAVMAAIDLAMRPLMDELSHAVGRETGNMAFYLTIAIGGGWAILAHLRFVAAPEPLDWITLFTLILFAASVIAAGRRGLLKPR
jgi:hypothetical protein